MIRAIGKSAAFEAVQATWNRHERDDFTSMMAPEPFEAGCDCDYKPIDTESACCGERKWHLHDDFITSMMAPEPFEPGCDCDYQPIDADSACCGASARRQQVEKHSRRSRCPGSLWAPEREEHRGPKLAQAEGREPLAQAKEDEPFGSCPNITTLIPAEKFYFEPATGRVMSMVCSYTSTCTQSLQMVMDEKLGVPFPTCVVDDCKTVFNGCGPGRALTV